MTTILLRLRTWSPDLAASCFDAHVTDRECVELLQWALPRLGLRWRGFSNLRGQVCKRIGRRMKALGLSIVAEYRALLERDEGEWAVLDAACRITISRFYRDRAVFDRLREELLPQEAKAAASEGRALRIWSAGSASGEEPYTVAAIMALEVAPRFTGLAWEVVASEVDPVLLERARRGVFPEGALKELPAELKARAFAPGPSEGELSVAPKVARQVEFREEDIRRSMPEGPFDFALCRNLAFTYFDEAGQRSALEELLARVRPGGLLVIGGHERLPDDAPSLERAAGSLPIFRRG